MGSPAWRSTSLASRVFDFLCFANEQANVVTCLKQLAIFRSTSLAYLFHWNFYSIDQLYNNLLASLRVPCTLVPLSPATNLFKQNLKIFRRLSDSVVTFSPTLMEICLLNYLESSCCTDPETFCFKRFQAPQQKCTRSSFHYKKVRKMFNQHSLLRASAAMRTSEPCHPWAIPFQPEMGT